MELDAALQRAGHLESAFPCQNVPIYRVDFSKNVTSLYIWCFSNGLTDKTNNLLIKYSDNTIKGRNGSVLEDSSWSKWSFDILKIGSKNWFWWHFLTTQLFDQLSPPPYLVGKLLEVSSFPLCFFLWYKLPTSNLPQTAVLLARTFGFYNTVVLASHFSIFHLLFFPHCYLFPSQNLSNSFCHFQHVNSQAKWMVSSSGSSWILTLYRLFYVLVWPGQLFQDW